MITPLVVLRLGLAQLIAWGTSYYLIGGFGGAIAAELGWSQNVVYGGFAVALLVMGLSSGWVGRLIDRRGGRRVMAAGALLTAAGCIVLALCHGIALYVVAWVCLGLAMRMSLYDAAFAALARTGGPQARRPMSQITLLGGLASTTFWPLGAFMAAHVGWRGALVAYAVIALACIPLNAGLSDVRYGDTPGAAPRAVPPPLAVGRRRTLIAAGLYALLATTTNFLNAAMSSHMIAILAGLGVAASVSVWIGSLRGVGQSSARLCEVAFGSRIHPLTLNLVASAMLPVAFVAGLFSGRSGVAAIAFAFLYGAGNGIITITRGTLPLVLFDHRTYGAFVGRLLAPGFVVSAAAPVAMAWSSTHFGEAGALYVACAMAALTLLAAVALVACFRRAAV